VFDGTDACVDPVLDMAEALQHPHHAARGTFPEIEGTRQPAPAPRFSRTVSHLRPRGKAAPHEVLAAFGFSDEDIATLLERAGE
jgi:alpha-methylacyl-CoA racemase